MPIGYHSLGAGIGMEIAALKGEEQLLLNVAYAYLQQYDHRKAPDNAANLYDQFYGATLYEMVEAYYAKLEEAERAAMEATEQVEIEEEESVQPTIVLQIQADEDEGNVPNSIRLQQIIPIICICIVFIVRAFLRYILYKRKNKK